MKTLRLLTFLAISFSSCRDKDDLGNSYYYLDPFEANDIGYQDGAIIYKSDKKLVFQKTIISKQVISVTHNDKFIFAKQLSTANVQDTNYYYIDKTTDLIYGPFSLDSSKKVSVFLKTGL